MRNRPPGLINVVVALSRAVAVTERDGPGHGLAALEAIVGMERPQLSHAALADSLRRPGRAAEAAGELVTSGSDFEAIASRVKAKYGPDGAGHPASGRCPAPGQWPLSLCGDRRGDHAQGLITAAAVAGISGRRLARPAGQGAAGGVPGPSRVAAGAARIFPRRDKVLAGLLEELERAGVDFRSATDGREG